MTKTLSDYLGKYIPGQENLSYSSFLAGGYDNLDLMKTIIEGAFLRYPDTYLKVLLVYEKQDRDPVKVFHVFLNISSVGWGYFPDCFAEGYSGEGPTAYDRFKDFCEVMRTRGMNIEEERLDVDWNDVAVYLPHYRDILDTDDENEDSEDDDDN